MPFSQLLEMADNFLKKEENSGNVEERENEKDSLRLNNVLHVYLAQVITTEYKD